MYFPFFYFTLIWSGQVLAAISASTRIASFPDSRDGHWPIKNGIHLACDTVWASESQVHNFHFVSKNTRNLTVGSHLVTIWSLRNKPTELIYQTWIRPSFVPLNLVKPEAKFTYRLFTNFTLFKKLFWVVFFKNQLFIN